MAEKTEEQRRTEWLEQRRRHITSTDVPTLMKLDDSYGSPMGVFLDKRGLAEHSAEVPEYMEWGNRLQVGILKGYADRVGEPVDLADPYELIAVPDFPLLAASLDARWHEKDLRPVDAKNVGVFAPREWGESYTDEIPARYIVQLHVQMLATGTQVADLAMLFGGQRMRIYRVERDEEIAAACREVAERFYHDHVLADLPPPVDASDEWSRFLNSRKQKTDDFIEATPEAVDWAKRLREAEATKDEAEAREKEARNHLKLIIGENAGVIGPFGRISFKRNQDSEKVDEKAVIDELAVKLCGVDPELAGFVEAVIQKHTTSKPGARPLRPTWHKEG